MPTMDAQRHLLRDLVRAALPAVDPELAVRSTCHLRSDRLQIGPHDLPLSGRLLLVAVGKAAPAMATGARAVLGDRLHRGVVVRPHGTAPCPDDDRLQIIAAGHPIPDAASRMAVEAIHRLVDGGDGR